MSKVEMRLLPTEIGFTGKMYDNGVVASYIDLFTSPERSDLACNRQTDSLIRRVVKGIFAALAAVLSLPDLLKIGAIVFYDNANGPLYVVAGIVVLLSDIMLTIPILITHFASSVLTSIAIFGQTKPEDNEGKNFHTGTASA